MQATVINTKSLPELLLGFIQTEKVRVMQVKDEINIKPIVDTECSIKKAKGSLADIDEMSVECFLARKRAERELEI